jgi:hypothetical protein
LGLVYPESQTNGKKSIRKENNMPEVKCAYHGMVDEDISIHFEDHRVLLGEKPAPPIKGVTYGSCMNAYSFITPDQAEKLGMRLIIAAAQKRKDDGE